MNKKVFCRFLTVFSFVTVLTACTGSKQGKSNYEQFTADFQSAKPQAIYLDIPKMPLDDAQDFNYSNRTGFYLDHTKMIEEGLQLTWQHGTIPDDYIAEGNTLLDQYYNDLQETIGTALQAISVKEIESNEAMNPNNFVINIIKDDQTSRLTVDRSWHLFAETFNRNERQVNVYQISSSDFKVFTDSIQEPTKAFSVDYENFMEKCFQYQASQTE